MPHDPKEFNNLAVLLHGRRVGVMNRLGGEKHLFSFDDDYINDPERLTLSLSFKGQAGGLVTSTPLVSRKIPPFFSNLLPEGHLRTYLAQRAGVKEEREFYLLAALGADLSGAITVQPIFTDERYEVRQKLQEADLNSVSADEVMRFSLAGVQLKFSAVLESTGGLTIPAHGVGGSWIVKLPSTRFAEVPENEFVMLELARAIGITVPKIKLVAVRRIDGLPDETTRMDGNALVVQRFDRGLGNHRIHMEDFAQVFGTWPDEKYARRSYANIAAVLWAETGDVGTYEFVRRLIFSILIGNGDMHLKNWSILYPDGRTPILAPAYDFVSTVPFIPNDKMALTFGGSRSLTTITMDQIRRFANLARLPANPVAKIIRETMERTAEAWKTLVEKDLLSAAMRESISAHMQTVLKNSTLT